MSESQPVIREQLYEMTVSRLTSADWGAGALIRLHSDPTSGQSNSPATQNRKITAISFYDMNPMMFIF